MVWKEKKGRKPLLLKGTRQVGKTYLLKELGKNVFPRYHYLNFEENSRLASVFEADLSPERILKELSFQLDASIDPRKDLLIFDEIQECPRALTSLKYFAETMPELALCGAGSLLGIKLADASFPVGKVEFLDLYPLSFEEFLQGIEDTRAISFLQEYRLQEPIPEVVHSHLWSRLLHYFVVGGLPEAVNTFREHQDDSYTAMEKVRKLQRSLVLAYLADMAKHAGKQNSMHLERLWRNIPAQLARTQNGSASKFRFKDAVPGIGGYERLSGTIDWLLGAGLILKASMVNSGLLPFSAYIKETFFKLYVFDVGMLGVLSQLPPKLVLDYRYGTYKGYFAENFVAQEFVGSEVTPLVYWKENTAEVEFLRENNGNVYPIEVKSGWVTHSKSLKVFADKYHPPFRIIMSARNISIDPARKLIHYPLYLAGRFPLKG